MAERMLKFVNLSRAMPEKRAVEARAQDFHEIYADFIDAKASEQASRRRPSAVILSQSGMLLWSGQWVWQNGTPHWEQREACSLALASMKSA